MEPIKHLSAILVLVSGLCAQQANITPFVPRANFGIDSINLQTLVPIIDIPIRSKGGPVPFYAHDTGQIGCNVGGSTYSGYGFYWSCFNGPVDEVNGIGLVLLPGTTTVGNPGCTTQTGVTQYSNWYLTDNPGNDIWHPFPGLGSVWAAYCGTNVTAESSDGSGLLAHLVTTWNNTTSQMTTTLTLTDKFGNVSTVGPITSYSVPSFLGPAPKYADAFGNSINITGTGTNETFNDSLNPSGTVFSINSASFPIYTYTDAGGVARQITVSEYGSGEQTLHTNFGCSRVQEAQSAPYTNGYFIGSYNFPDGTSESFGYESVQSGTITGRMNSITLRNGGTISYTYGPMNCAYYRPLSLTRVTADGATTYTVSVSGSNNQSTTTVLDPGNNKTVYTFTGYYAAAFAAPLLSNAPVLTEIQVYQNTNTVASPVYTLLSTTVYCYNTNTTNCASAAVAYPITQKDIYNYVGATSVAMSHSTQLFDGYGDITSNSTYDYITGQTLSTTTHYGSWAGSLPCPAVGSNIQSSPCDVVTSDGTHTLSETRFTYNSQGFATQTQKWTGSTWLTSSATPNSNGTAASSTDINGQVTNYSYTGSGGCNALLLTGTSTVVSGVTLTTGKTWDCNDGMLLSSTDANTTNTTHYSYDDMLRPASVTDPTSYMVTTTYTANSTTTSDSFDATATTTTVDGLGRRIRTQTTAGSQYNTTSVIYSFYGYPAWNIWTSSACLTSLGGGCANLDRNVYDPLGRLQSITNNLGGTRVNGYNQNDVQLTIGPAPSGEYNKVFQTEFDGLGRVKSSCGLLSAGGTACGQVDGGFGKLTTNAYSFGAGTSTVTSTRGSQTHTTISDALGRPTSVTLPEVGTSATTSIYDTVSTADSCYGANAHSYGDLMQVTQADGSYLCFNYDRLHRLTDVGNSNENPPNVCKRFRYDSTSNGVVLAPSGYNSATANIKGRLMEAETDNCSLPETPLTDEWFAYDPDGRVTDVWESTPHSGGYYHTTAGYYPNGQLNTLSGVPGNSTYTISLDSNGRPISSVLAGKTIVQTLTRDGANRPLTITYGNGTNYDTYTYNPDGTMNSYSFASGSLTDSGTLTWNADNTLQQLVINDGFYSADSQTCTFSYDEDIRLATDNCGSSLWNQSYSYDIYDNLTKTGNPGTTWSPGYSASTNHITGAGYDGRGNVTYDLINTYTWNAYNKLASSRPGTSQATCGSAYYCYTYDAFGREVEFSSNSTYTEYLYSPVGRLGTMSGQTTTNAIYPTPGGGTVLVAGANGAGQIGVNHRDWLGSNRLQTALSSSTVFLDAAYSPYGETYVYESPGGQYRNMFTGDFVDHGIAGLYDTPNRELASGSGSRWLSPDPAHAGWNAYSYTTNPNGAIDSLGLEPGDPNQTAQQQAYACSVSGDNDFDSSCNPNYLPLVNDSRYGMPVMYTQAEDGSWWFSTDGGQNWDVSIYGIFGGQGGDILSTVGWMFAHPFGGSDVDNSVSVQVGVVEVDTNNNLYLDTNPGLGVSFNQTVNGPTPDQKVLANVSVGASDNPAGTSVGTSLVRNSDGTISMQGTTFSEGYGLTPLGPWQVQHPLSFPAPQPPATYDPWTVQTNTGAYVDINPSSCYCVP